MTPSNTSLSFTVFEQAILDWYVSEYHDKALSAQLRAAKLLKRKYDGVGFSLSLEVSRSFGPVDAKELGQVTVEKDGTRTVTLWPILGPELGDSPDITLGGGCLLWGEDGYVNRLEIYSHVVMAEEVTDFTLLQPSDLDDDEEEGE